MDIKKIRQLADIFEATGLTSLEITEGDACIRMEKQAQGIAPQPAAQAAPAQEPAPEARLPQGAPEVDFNALREVTAPMAGVFYAASAPDADPYVGIGSKVKKGDVLCIVEAMKLMNEIAAEIDGEIVDICVRNGDIVEFGQTMFKIF